MSVPPVSINKGRCRHSAVVPVVTTSKQERDCLGQQDQDQLAADLQDRLTLTKKRTQRKIDNYAQYPTNRTPEDTLHLLCREADLNPPLNRARK